MPKDPNLMKGLVFYLEIYCNGKQTDEYFKNNIMELGGRITPRLGSHVTHMIWSDGKPKTLLRVSQQYTHINIVSTLWFTKCFEEMRLADEANFLPPRYNQILTKALEADLKSTARGLKKTQNKTMVAKTGLP